MREHFLVDWACASRGAVEKVVQAQFAHEAHRWSLLRAFDFEGYIWNSTHLIVILRDKPSGIMRGSSIPKPLKDINAPTKAPSIANLDMWQLYMRRKFAVKHQDMAIIIPIVGKGPNVTDDWAEWSETDKHLWDRQIKFNIEQQFYYLKSFDINKETGDLVECPVKIENYYFYGPTTIIKDNNEVREVRTGDTIDINAQTIKLGGQSYHLEQTEGQARLLQAIFGRVDDPQEFLALLKEASQQAANLSAEIQQGIKTQTEHMLKSQDAGFKAKLRKTWDKITREGWEMGKGILVDVVSEVIRKSIV